MLASSVVDCDSNKFCKLSISVVGLRGFSGQFVWDTEAIFKRSRILVVFLVYVISLRLLMMTLLSANV